MKRRHKQEPTFHEEVVNLQPEVGVLGICASFVAGGIGLIGGLPGAIITASGTMLAFRGASALHKRNLMLRQLDLRVRRRLATPLPSEPERFGSSYAFRGRVRLIDGIPGDHGETIAASLIRERQTRMVTIGMAWEPTRRVEWRDRTRVGTFAVTSADQVALIPAGTVRIRSEPLAETVIVKNGDFVEVIGVVDHTVSGLSRQALGGGYRSDRKTVVFPPDRDRTIVLLSPTLVPSVPKTPNREVP
ncbi:MAG: hypothetical protein AAGF12_30945 [Myxococcota bacterium]